MSSVLTRDRGEQRRSTDARERAVKAVKAGMEKAGSGGSSGSLPRAFLVVDLGAAMGSLFGDHGRSSGVVEEVADRGLETATGDGRGARGSGGKSGGRSTLRTLFLLGMVAGVGYVLRTRMGSMDEMVDRATERTRSVTDDTAMRAGEAAGRAETVTEEAAERIEESGEMAADRVASGSEEVADRVREGGEQAADRVEEAGETVEEMEQEAEERAEEMTDEGGEETGETTDEESEE